MRIQAGRKLREELPPSRMNSYRTMQTAGTAGNAPIPLRPKFSSVFSRSTAILLFAIACYKTVPEDIWRAILPWKTSTENPLIVLCFLSFLLEALFYRSKGGRMLLLLAIAGAVMALVGIWRGSYLDPGVDPRILPYDILIYCGAVLGFGWGRRRTPEQLARFFRRLCLVMAGALACTVIGLQTGILTPLSGGARLYTFSLFHATWSVACLCPFILLGKDPQRPGGHTKRRLVIVGACLMAILGAALVSGTRSMLVEATLAALFCLWGAARETSVKHWPKVGAITLAFALLVLAITPTERSEFIAERYRDTEFRSEGRVEEAVLLFQDLREDVVWGRGFGSWFYTGRSLSPEEWAWSAHIGVLTPLLKGGVFLFSLLVVWPVVSATRCMTVNKNPWVFRCWGVVVSYPVFASLAGGWSFLLLFWYAACWAAATRTSGQSPRNTAAGRLLSPCAAGN